MRIIIQIIGMLALIGFSFTSFGQNPIRINGYARTYIGVLLEGPNDYSIIQNTLDIDLEHRRSKIAFKANPYVYHYAPKSFDYGLRDLYMDIYTKKLDLRIGKQQIVWGKADGVFVTDIVSPKNLTEFLLWDFEEIRMGVTAVKADYYVKDHSFELVWLPVFSPTTLPAKGSIWRKTPEFSMPVETDDAQEDVPLRIEHSELFGKYSYSASAIDIEVMGGYTWDDDPAIHLSIQTDSNGLPAGVLITPKHHRLGVAGASFSTDIKGFIWRGEAAWYFGKYFSTGDPLKNEGLSKKDYLHYVTGIDKFLGNWKFSVQFIQQYIAKYDPAIEQRQFDNMMTVLVNRSLFREKAQIELFSYIGLDNPDALIRLRTYYFPYDGISLELGTNVFLGNKGYFGQFDANDMIYIRAKYSF